MQKAQQKAYSLGSPAEDFFGSAVALILALLLHVAIYEVLPEKFSWAKIPKEQTSIEILPLNLKPKTPDFIEANPYANDLKPEKPAPVSFKNQRAADEIPDKTSDSNRPFVKGEDKRYKKIVSGTAQEQDRLDPSKVLDVLRRPLTPQSMADVMQQNDAKEQQEAPRPARQAASSPNAPMKKSAKTPAQNMRQMPGANAAKAKTGEAKTKTAQSQKAAAQKSPVEQTKAQNQPDKTKTESALNPDRIDKIVANDDPQAIAIPQLKPRQNVSQNEAPATIPKPENARISEISPAASTGGAQAAAIAENPALPAPRKRPQLSMRIPPGPLADNNRAASRAGIVAVDSRFSEFGAYQQRMIEAISRQWNLLGSRYDLSSAYGTQVLIEFWLDTEGQLSNLQVLFSTSTQTGAGLCQQAILSTAPYGVWTQEMVNTLGSLPQRVRINFLYR